MAGIRAELLGETTPDFLLALPPGWVRQAADEGTRDALLAAARTRLMAVHRPDLYAQVASLATRAFRDMDRTETFAFFGPGPDAPEESFLPVSVTASIRRGPDGGTLDDTIAHVIRTSGATPLGDDRRWVRWATEGTTEVDGVPIDTHTVAYLTPVPGSGRRRALQFTVVITHDRSAPGDEDWLEQMTTVWDIYLSTFAWANE